MSHPLNKIEGLLGLPPRKTLKGLFRKILKATKNHPADIYFAVEYDMDMVNVASATDKVIISFYLKFKDHGNVNRHYSVKANDVDTEDLPQKLKSLLCEKRTENQQIARWLEQGKNPIRCVQNE